MRTQGSGRSSINVTLAADLAAQPWAKRVSPEVLVFDTVRGQPVLVRGADADLFVAIEGGTWTDRANLTGDLAYVGQRLAGRLHLALGDAVDLAGSATAALAVVRVAGIFATPSTAGDELVVGFGVARFLAGLRSNLYHTIRVQTSEPSALLGYLGDSPASVYVSGPGVVRADIHSAPPADERITNLFLRYGSGQIEPSSVPTLLSQGTNSVRVVVLGFALLLALLVGLGVHAVQARAFEDRRPSVGVLRGIGAGGGWLRRRLLVEALPPALAAAILGAGLGLTLSVALAPLTAVVVFGHTVTPTFDAATFVLIVGAVVVASMASNALLLSRVLRQRPLESIQERPSGPRPGSLEARL